VRRVTMICLAGGVVGAALLGGCVARAPRNAELEPVDWGGYALVPCNFDLSCRNPSAGLQLADPVAPELVSFADDPVPTDLVKSYLERIRSLERELQRERLERAQLERQLRALREIEREVARASGEHNASSGRPTP
jgi:hypothetical protein